MKKIIELHPDAEDEVIEAIEAADVQLRWTATAAKDYTVVPNPDQ